MIILFVCTKKVILSFLNAFFQCVDQLTRIQAELQETVKDLAKGKKKYFETEQMAQAVREKADIEAKYVFIMAYVEIIATPKSTLVLIFALDIWLSGRFCQVPFAFCFYTFLQLFQARPERKLELVCVVLFRKEVQETALNWHFLWTVCQLALFLVLKPPDFIFCLRLKFAISPFRGGEATRHCFSFFEINSQGFKVFSVPWHPRGWFPSFQENQ